MAALLPCTPTIASPPFTNRLPLRPHSHAFSGTTTKRFLLGSLSVARFGFQPGFLPEPEDAEFVLRELFHRAEGFVYTIADAAVSSSDTAVTTTVNKNNDWLSGITNYMETVLKVLKDGLSTLHVPYAYGFAIIMLTVLVKAATFPLTRKQVESTMAMRSLQPQVKAIQKQYAGDQERIQLETARLYKLANINPLAGCLPVLLTTPVWIGLYRAFSNVADEGLLNEGFFWIPSLSGPTSIAARQNGSAISWLFPFVDGQPPLGWPDTLAYLVLPLLLVVSQYISLQIMQSAQATDPNMKSSQVLNKVLPLVIGYFALSVPSGLSLYWFTNNILSTLQQVWLQKLGGAKNPVRQVLDDNVKNDVMQIQKSVSKVNSTKVGEARKSEKLTSEGPRPGDRFKQLMEQEARKKQQREEEKRKAEEAAAKAKHEKTIEGGNKAVVGNLVDNSQSVAASDTDPSISGVVNGNPLSKDLYGNQNSISTSDAENDEGSAHFNAVNEKNLEKVEEAGAKAKHEETIEGGNQAVGNLVDNSQSVAAFDTDPSITGVVNGNPLSKDLEGNKTSISTSDAENDEGSAHFNAVNGKNLEKEPQEVLTTTSTTNKQPHGEDSDRMAKD